MQGHADTQVRCGYNCTYSLLRPPSSTAPPAPDTRRPDYFANHGITGIERLMTDNAWAYRWSLRQICAEHGIRQIFIKPHCPWQNGKVERLNRTLQTEGPTGRSSPATPSASRPCALAEHYNTRRRHSALGGLPPISRL